MPLRNTRKLKRLLFIQAEYLLVRRIKRWWCRGQNGIALGRYVKTWASVNGTTRKTAQATIKVDGRVLDQVKNEPLERRSALGISITAG